MELALRALAACLESAGSSIDSVLKTTLFITRQDDFPEMNEIYARFFSEPWPARSTIVTGLALPGLLFEVEACAHLVDR